MVSTGILVLPVIQTVAIATSRLILHIVSNNKITVKNQNNYISHRNAVKVVVHDHMLIK